MKQFLSFNAILSQSDFLVRFTLEMLLIHNQPSNTHTDREREKKKRESCGCSISSCPKVMGLNMHSSSITHTHTLFPTVTMLQNKAIVAHSDWAAAVAMQPSKRSQ